MLSNMYCNLNLASYAFFAKFSPVSTSKKIPPFARMLKPLSQQYAANSTQGNSDD